ncbi:MAG: ADP-ribosylglycohydrolase family protein, partial [Myxococcaceae bacterium]
PWMSAGAPIGTTDASCLSRALIAGLWHHDDPSKLAHEAGVLAVVTHKEPRCAAAAAAYARAVSLGFSADRLTPHDFCEELARAAAVHDEAFAEELRHLPRVLSWEEDRALELLRRVAVPSAELNDTDGLPAHVSPVLLTALYAALKVPHDFRLAMRLLLRAGGEIDAAAALLGGLLGAHLGMACLPPRLRKGVLYVEQLESAATKLAAARSHQYAPALARAAARRQGA